MTTGKVEPMAIERRKSSPKGLLHGALVAGAAALGVTPFVATIFDFNVASIWGSPSKAAVNQALAADGGTNPFNDFDTAAGSEGTSEPSGGTTLPVPDILADSLNIQSDNGAEIDASFAETPNTDVMPPIQMAGIDSNSNFLDVFSAGSSEIDDLIDTNLASGAAAQQAVAGGPPAGFLSESDRNGLDAAVVPVPGALPLMGTALAWLGYMGWRRRRRSA